MTVTNNRLTAACLTVLILGCGQQDVGQPVAEPDATATEASNSTADAGQLFFEVEDGFKLLGLDDFEVFHGTEPTDEQTWTAEGELLQCTGNPRGYLYSRQPYTNFTLRLDYRFVPQEGADETKLSNSNTGFLIYITGDDKLWPVSLEVQGKHVEMAHIKANGGAAAIDVEDNETARNEHRQPVGEWNSIEIASKDGSLTSLLNGAKICQSQPGELTSGLIGIQSEDFETQFRNLRIREED